MKHARLVSRAVQASAGALLVSCLAIAPAVAASGSHHLMTLLSPTGATPPATGKAKYTVVRSRSHLTVTTHGLPPGLYDIRVGGGVVGTMDVTPEADAEGVAKFVLDSRLSSGLLFDPRGTALEIVNQASGVTELYTDRFPADKAEETAKITIDAPFSSTGLQPAASGEVEYRSFKGRSRLVVKVAGLSSGAYDLIVGGMARAKFAVEGLEELALSFESLPTIGLDQASDGTAAENPRDRSGEGSSLLLSFDPAGLPVAITLGGQTVLLIDPFPAP